MSTYCPTCGNENSSDTETCNYCETLLATRGTPHGILSPGAIINSRYKINELIKVGGMGAVYLGYDLDEDKIIAIKQLFLSSGDEEDQFLVSRFEREATLLSGLDHPNLPKVSDYFNDYDNYFMIMDYIEGLDLECVLKKQGNPGLPEMKVIDWALELCSVLKYLHNHNPPILYRDIKPSNIVIREIDERAILVDFGLARTIENGMSAGKTAIGTVGYSPPEQYEGRQKPQSDIYALGATLHHLLTGKFPEIPFYFDPVRSFNPRISIPMEKVVMKALEPDLNNRFTTALEMEKALLYVKQNKDLYLYKPKEKKKIEEAETELNEIGQDPDLSKGHSNLAVLYARKGYYNHARRELNKSIKLNANSSEAYSNLGYVCLMLEDYDKAIEHLKHAIKLDKTLSVAYCNLGVVYSRTGQMDEAIEQFRRALQIDPRLAEAHVNLSHIYGTKGRYDKMIDECRKAIKIKPDSMEAYVNFAYACGRAGMPEDGIRKLEKALIFDSSSAVAFSNLGVLYGEINKNEKAIDCFTKAISIKPDLVEAHSNLGVIYYKQGNYDAARDSFKKSIMIDPEFTQAKSNLAHFSREQKLSKVEAEGIKKLINASPEEIINGTLDFSPREVSFMKDGKEELTGVLTYEEKENNKDKKRKIEAEIALDSDDPDKYIKLGNHYLETDAVDDAIRQYQQALRIKSSHTEGHFYLGAAYEKKGLHVLAESEYRKVVKLMPSHFRAHLNLGSILFDKADIDGAVKHYLKSLSSGGDTHETYYKLGLCYKKMGKIKQAIAAFESAIEREGNRGEIYFNFGMVYYDNKELHYKAEELFKLAIKKKPDYAEAHLYLGNIYYKKRMLSEAMEQYKEAIDLKEDYAIAYSNLGAVYNDFNMLDKARECYFRAIEINDNLAEAHLNLGVLHQKQKNYEKAIKEMKIYMNMSDGKDIEEIKKRINEMERKIIVESSLNSQL